MILGTMIVIALLPGCSDDNDPKLTPCEKATADKEAASVAYKKASDEYAAKWETSTVEERNQLLKAKQDAQAQLTIAHDAKAEACK